MLFAVTGKATASSTYKDNDDKWGPHNAIDGLWSDTTTYFFSSKKEHMPWLQWRLHNQTKIAGVVISNRNQMGGENLVDVEIRAGIDSVAADASKRIKINELCGTFKGPGANRRVYTVMCKKEIVANYVTLQIVDTDSILQINELEIIPASKGMSTCTYTKLIFFKH